MKNIQIGPYNLFQKGNYPIVKVQKPLFQVGGEAFTTRNKLNLRMDLAIGRKPDYRPAGYTASAEERKTT